MLSRNIKNYLDSHEVKYKTISHPTAYTASQSAQSAHIKGRYFAKCVVVKLDNKLCLIAIPANRRIDLDELKRETKCKKVELAHEYEFQDKFNDCEVGAMPPFGELYGMEVYLAESLKNQDWLAFNAGNHQELLKISCKEFLELVQPHSLHRH